MFHAANPTAEVTMPLIEQTLQGRTSKVDIAIKRIKAMCPVTYEGDDRGIISDDTRKPYYVAYSGGKDSDVIRILMELANVPHELWHNHTTIDAPETVCYVRSIPGMNISYPKTTMWKLIVQKNMPPTRIIRYCCSHLKETGGHGRFVVTGVRSAESNTRKRRGVLSHFTPKKADSVQLMYTDNDARRKMSESCPTKSRWVLNPIIDWSDDDVWEFLSHHGCKSNPLYEARIPPNGTKVMGHKRIGCVGCPMATRKQREADFITWPKYKDAYLRAFERMLQNAKGKGKRMDVWRSAEEVFDWWMRDAPKCKVLDGQMELLSE